MKALKIITIELLILAITIASFIGIYKKDEYRVKNLIPDYKLGMNFEAQRVLTLKVDDNVKETLLYDKDGNLVENREDGVDYTEENGYKTVEVKENDESILTEANYKKTKNILLRRLQELNVGEYTLELNKETGEIKIVIPENDKSDEIAYYLEQTGKFTLTDSETDEVLLDESHLKDAGLLYGSHLNDEGKTESYIYLQLKFDKEGIKTINDLANIYISKNVEKENEDGEKEETTEEKKLTINLNGESLGSTIITNIIYNNTLALTLGSSTEPEEFTKLSENAANIVKILKSGTLQIKYNDEETTIEKNTKIDTYFKYYELSFMIVTIALCCILIVKYKTKGMIGSLLQIGYLATLLIILRYTNVIITETGICGILIAIVLNFLFIINMLNPKESFNGIVIRHFLHLIPLYIISIFFAFSNSNYFSSFGMTLTWGAILIYLYNFLFAKPLEDFIKEGKNEKN